MLKSKKTPEEYWRQINNQYDSNGELINKIPELVLQTRQGNVKKVAENEQIEMTPMTQKSYKNQENNGEIWKSKFEEAPQIKPKLTCK